MIYCGHMQSKEKYFLYILLAGALVVTFFIFLPFLIPLVLGVSFSVVLSPLYKRILTELKGRSSLAALLTVISFIFIVCIPLTGIAILGYQETQSVFSTDPNTITPSVSQMVATVQSRIPEWMNIDVQAQIAKVLPVISQNIGNIFSATFGTLLSLFLVILSMFFFLRDGKQWRAAVIKINPLSDSRNEVILNSLERSIRGIVTGYLFIALVQGILMGLGMWVFGVPHVILWGLAAAVAALIPVVGTLAVSVPITIYLFATGNTLPAIGFMSWALVLVGRIDNVLNPIVVGRKVNIHPLMILLSVLGGVSFFGPAGILLGPLVASLLYTLITMYRQEFE